MKTITMDYETYEKELKTKADEERNTTLFLVLRFLTDGGTLQNQFNWIDFGSEDISYEERCTFHKLKKIDEIFNKLKDNQIENTLKVVGE